MFKIKEKSIILVLCASEIQMLNSYANDNYRILHDEELEQKSYKERVYKVEMFESSFHLLPYLKVRVIDSLTCKINNKGVYATTKENSIKLSENADFKNAILLNIPIEYDDMGLDISFDDDIAPEFDYFTEEYCFDLVYDLLRESRIKLNLTELDYHLNLNYEQTDTIIPKLLDYRSEHFTEEEITDYYDIKGLEFKSEQDLQMAWTYIWENNEITLIGYKGHFEKVKIPKKLNDGTIISKIDNHILSQNNDEFLYVNTKIEDAYSNGYRFGELDFGDKVSIPENTLQVELSSSFLTRHMKYDFSKSTNMSFVEVCDY